MSGSLSSSHDTTHTDMLLPGVHGEAAEEEASMLQPSISHQTETSILQTSLSQDPHLLQQNISQTDSGLIQQSISNSQTGEETLIQSEDLAGMHLMSGDCNTVLHCDLTNTQPALSMESLGHSATALPYNDGSPSSGPALTYASLHCDLSGTSLAVNPNTTLLPSVLSSGSVIRNSQIAQPTYMTTTAPISSLLQAPVQQQASENLNSVQAQTTVKPTILPNILQQAIALNTNLVTALANLPFVQSNLQQSSSGNQTQNLIPISQGPAAGIIQTIPTNIRNVHAATSTNHSSNPVPAPVNLQRILPDTQKPSANSVVTSCGTNIQIPTLLSGQTVYCTPGQTVPPLDTSVLPQVLNSLPPPLSSPATQALQGNPSQPSSNLTSNLATSPSLVGVSQASSPPTTASSVASQPGVVCASGTQQLSADQAQAATFLSQFPMPLSVMSTQETSALAAPSELQSLHACLSHPLLQSLTQQNLVTSLANQIVLNPARATATTSTSIPLPQLDIQQTATLLRQAGYNISDSDTSSILASVTGANTQTSTAATSTESFSAPPPSSLSPMLSLPAHFQSSSMLPSVSLSPSESMGQNLTTRLYLTSPVTVAPQSQEKSDTPDPGEAAAQAFTLANMSGAVIDMLLKHPTDLPDVDRAALPEKERENLAPSSENPPTPKLTGQYCIECNHSYKSGCTYHKVDYTYVEDKPIPPRAQLTLPSCLLLQTSGIKITAEEISNLGVFAGELIEKRTEFGPLKGKVMSEDSYTYTNSFTWKIFYWGEHQVVDVGDEEECNWLIYVKPAPSLQEQNVVVYQRGEQLYFVTNKRVEPGTELLFWFSKEYAKLLGLPARPSALWPSNCPFCHVCNLVFSDWKSLNKHMKSEHPNSSSRKWPCHVCSRRFTTSTKLKTHMVALHMRLKPFTCTQCGKKFSDQSNLRQHMNIHTGERKFKCTMCSKSFRQKAHLQSHMIVHTGSAGLQCRFCDAKIARPSDLKSHELKHTKEKCYPCALCIKVFYKLANYKKHMLVHNKERNFMCPDCGKLFYSKYHVTRHIKTCKGTKAGGRGLGPGEDNLYSTLEGGPDVNLDLTSEDTMILSTTTSICAPLRAQRQDR